MKLSKEVKFGIMAILAILAFVFGMSYMKGSRVFGSTMLLYAEYENANSLIRGNPVMLNGLAVGRVTNLRLKEAENNKVGNVLVTLELDHPQPIPKNSRAEIYSADLLGSMAVEIVLGDSKELLEDEDPIQGALKVGMLDEAGSMIKGDLGPLLEKLNTLAGELGGVAKSLNKSLASDEQGEGGLEGIVESLDGAMANMERLTVKLNSLGRTVDSLAVSATGVMQNIEGSNANITDILQNVNTLTDSLAVAGGDIKSLAQDASVTMANFSKISEELTNEEGTLGLLINDKSLYTELDSTITSLGALLDAIQENPRKYLDVNVYVFGGKKKRRETGEKE